MEVDFPATAPSGVQEIQHHKGPFSPQTLQISVLYRLIEE